MIEVTFAQDNRPTQKCTPRKQEHVTRKINMTEVCLCSRYSNIWAVQLQSKKEQVAKYSYLV